MASLGKIARRTFLFGAAAIAGGAAFGYYYVNKPYANPLEGDLADGEATFNPYVKITADNTITVIVPRAEMGQGISTTLAALVAEELDVPLDAIKVEHGPASWAYYNSAMLEEGGPFAFFDEGLVAETVRGAMGGAWQSSRPSGHRRLGLDPRRLRQDAPGGRRGAPCARRGGRAKARTCQPANSKPRTARSRTRRRANPSLMARSLRMPPRSTRRRASTAQGKGAWKLLGKPQKRTDMLAKVTGAPIFGVDVSLAGHALRHCQDQPASSGRSR